MIADTTREYSVFYSLLPDDAKEYGEPQLSSVYTHAMRDLQQVVSTQKYLQGAAGNRILAMARIEAAKEVEIIYLGLI